MSERKKIIFILACCLLFFLMGAYLNFITADYIWTAEYIGFAILSCYTIWKYARVKT